MDPGGPSLPVRPWGGGGGLKGSCGKDVPPAPPAPCAGEEQAVGPSLTKLSLELLRRPWAGHLPLLAAYYPPGVSGPWGAPGSQREAQQAGQLTSQGPATLTKLSGPGARPGAPGDRGTAGAGRGLGNGCLSPHKQEVLGLSPLQWVGSVPCRSSHTRLRDKGQGSPAGASGCWGRPGGRRAINPNSWGWEGTLPALAQSEDWGRWWERGLRGLRGRGGALGKREHSHLRRGALAAQPLLVSLASLQPLSVPGWGGQRREEAIKHFPAWAPIGALSAKVQLGVPKTLPSRGPCPPHTGPRGASLSPVPLVTPTGCPPGHFSLPSLGLAPSVGPLREPRTPSSRPNSSVRAHERDL